MTQPTIHNTTPVRIALVGLGGHGRTIQRAVAEAANLEVVAVFDPVVAEADEAVARFGCAKAASFDALLERDDVDALSLCSPNHMHREQATAALAAGLDVFVEKPIANTVADGRAMAAAAEQGGRILMVGHNMRRSTAVRRARAVLEASGIGTVVSAEVHFSSDTALRLEAASWRLHPDQCPLLPMMQLGIHGVDLLHYLLGPVRSVAASARSVTTVPPVVDSVVALLTFEDGAHGTMASNYCSPVQFAYQIAGTEGLLKGTPHTLVVTGRDGTVLEQHDGSDAPLASYTDQMSAFGQAVRTRERPETDGWSGIQALAVIEAMQASITNEAWATVPDARAVTLSTKES